MPARDEQRRFVHHSVEDYCGLLQELHGARLGIAPHSLRAVSLQVLLQLIKNVESPSRGAWPIHIHVSEQRREVEECRAAFGTTPIDLLARSVELDHRWSLVHATHATQAERRTIINRDATVVLCPVTEAYLGDGLFAADEFTRQGGRFAIGSDSNCRIDAVEELRWLEYGQRLRSQQRARLAGPRGLGATLWQQACTGGAAALAEPVGAIAPGHRADLVVLDQHAPPWLGHDVDTLLDAFIIGGSRHDIAQVYVGGRCMVDHGVAKDADTSAREFARVVMHLTRR